MCLILSKFSLSSLVNSLTGSAFSSSAAARLSATARVVVVVRAVPTTRRASRPGRTIAIAFVRACVVACIGAADTVVVVVVVRILVADDLCLLATARSTVHVVVGARPIILVGRRARGTGKHARWVRARGVFGRTGASRAGERIAADSMSLCRRRNLFHPCRVLSWRRTKFIFYGM